MFNRNRNRNRGNNNNGNEPKEWFEKHGTTSDILGLVINGVLAILTFIAIVISFQANQTSRDALNRQIEKDKSDSSHQVYYDSVGIIKDSINKKSFDRSLAIADSNTKISLQALKETQRRFEIENDAFIQVYPIISIDTVSHGILFRYQIRNYGKPVILTGSVVSRKIIDKNELGYFMTRSEEFLKKQPYTIPGNLVLSNVTTDTLFISKDPLNDTERKDLFENKKLIMYIGKIRFKNKAAPNESEYHWIMQCVLKPYTSTLYETRVDIIYSKQRPFKN